MFAAISCILFCFAVRCCIIVGFFVLSLLLKLLSKKPGDWKESPECFRQRIC